MGIIHNRRYLKPYRKELRNNLTPAEATLWQYLKNSSLANRKFRRQHSIGNYILDFYCPSEKLAIELDGAGHFTAAGEARDMEKEQYLSTLNIRVLHFENKEVFDNLEGVLFEIESKFTTPAPPQRGGEPDNTFK